MKPWAPLIRPSRGTYPLHGLRLNRSHPLAKDLFFLAVGDFEFVNQRFADYKRSGGAYAPTGAIGPVWRSWLPAATTDNAMGWDNIPNPPRGNSGHTILSYMNPQKSLQSYGAYVCFSPNPGAQTIGLSLFGWQPASKAMYRWETAAGTVAAGPTSGDFWQLASDAYRSARVFGAAYSPEDQAVHYYRDGRFFETQAAVTSSPFEAGEFHAALGNVQAQGADGNEAFANFYVTAAWRRALTPREHRLFAENPYLLLEARVSPVVFMPVAGGGAQSITGAGAVDDDQSGAGAIDPGAVAIDGSGAIDDDDSGAGAVAPGAVSIDGTGHTDDDQAGSGQVDPGAVSIDGSGAVDDDAAGAGTVSQDGPPAQGVAGAGAIDDDQSGAGTVNPGAVSIDGAGHVDDDAAGSGAVSQGAPPDQEITGAGAVDDDAAGSGVVSAGPPAQIIGGDGAIDDDQAGAGTVSPGAVGIDGSAAVDDDDAGSGTADPGAVSIDGSGAVDGDAAGAGTVSQDGPPAQAITGTGAIDDDQSGAGAIAAGAVEIEGAGHVDDDASGSGSVYREGEAGRIAVTAENSLSGLSGGQNLSGLGV